MSPATLWLGMLQNGVLNIMEVLYITFIVGLTDERKQTLNGCTAERCKRFLGTVEHRGKR
jgi:hypothetical protein